MAKQKIARAVAKDELARLNGILEKPHILIGGLAVQQYVSSRESVDIDLLCDFSTIQDIIKKLYPLKDWYVEEINKDDYRPSFVIKHRHKPIGNILFGPKVRERGSYKYLDWDELTEGAKPFAHAGKELSNILVPTLHALTYSKLVSVIGRDEKNGQKIQQDLSDFSDLINCPDFSLASFYDLLLKNDDTGSVREQFRFRAQKFPQALSGCCLASLSEMFMQAAPVTRGVSAPATRILTVYLAGPHANVQRNRAIADAIETHGVTVKVPFDEVERASLENTQTHAKEIRAVCIEAIDASDIVAVDLDTYGLDTAWEIGYAEGKKKHIVGFNLHPELGAASRSVNRRIYSENFMHNWNENEVYEGIDSADAVATKHKGRKLYVCGSFSNRAIEQLQRTKITSECKLLLPKSLVRAKNSLPKNYPLTERDAMNKHLASSDAILVVLPRYGMDAAWQIGYAAALGKEILGIRLRDDHKETSVQSYWDHWMHGWKAKVHVTSLAELVTYIRGFALT